MQAPPIEQQQDREPPDSAAALDRPAQANQASQRDFSLWNVRSFVDKTLSNKPNEIQTRFFDEYPQDTITTEHLYNWINAWKNSNNDYQPGKRSYTDDKAGDRKLAKDAIKYHLYKKFEWRSIGVAQYMTGDVTGLGIASALDPKLTIKVLKGMQYGTKNPARPAKIGPSFYRPGAPSELDENSYNVFEEQPNVFDTAKNRNQIIETDLDKKSLTSKKPPYDSTVDLYKYQYNVNQDKKPIKPFNLETYHATDIIAKNYKNHKDQIIESLLPDSNARERIEKYKNEKFNKLKNDPMILVWQRRSGAKGGAHPELDSHPTMLKQLIKEISGNFPDNKIVMLGDPVPGIAPEKLKEIGVGEDRLIMLNEFWKDNQETFKTREDQNYLMKLLGEQNNAVSIGMRSGSLEASALLGLNTIFLDNLGTNAEERMESWSGSFAYTRGARLADPTVDWQGDERENAGPIPEYKRVGTFNELGNAANGRVSELEQLLQPVEQMQTLMRALSPEELADNNDHIIDKAIGAFTEYKAHVAKSSHSITNHDSAASETKAESKKYKKLLNALKIASDAMKNRRKNRFSVDKIYKYQQTIHEAIDQSFLLPNETDQIVGLIRYLRDPANLPSPSAEPTSTASAADERSPGRVLRSSASSGGSPPPLSASKSRRSSALIFDFENPPANGAARSPTFAMRKSSIARR